MIMHHVLEKPCVEVEQCCKTLYPTLEQQLQFCLRGLKVVWQSSLLVIALENDIYVRLLGFVTSGVKHKIALYRVLRLLLGGS